MTRLIISTVTLAWGIALSGCGDAGGGSGGGGPSSPQFNILVNFDATNGSAAGRGFIGNM